MIRCKFKCVTIDDVPGSSVKRARFEPVWDAGIPEDDRFTRATPSGSLSVNIDNPRAMEGLEVGASYFLDLRPIRG